MTMTTISLSTKKAEHIFNELEERLTGIFDSTDDPRFLAMYNAAVLIYIHKINQV